MVFGFPEQGNDEAHVARADNLSLIRWACPTRLELRPGWTAILLTRKNQAKFGPAPKPELPALHVAPPSREASRSSCFNRSPL